MPAGSRCAGEYVPAEYLVSERLAFDSLAHWILSVHISAVPCSVDYYSLCWRRIHEGKSDSINRCPRSCLSDFLALGIAGSGGSVLLLPRVTRTNLSAVGQ